jgi:hypothetical protein
MSSEGKVISLLYEAPLHEDILESGGIAPHILNVSTRWIHQPLYVKGKDPSTHWIESWESLKGYVRLTCYMP